MHKFNVTILGSNSAISVHNRYPSSQVLQIGNNSILIDCGEGTQFRMAEYGIKKSKIDVILISHLHGDHVFGLPGLLTSLQLTGRTKPLTILGPEPIQNFLNATIGDTGHFISYPLIVKTIKKEDFSTELIQKIHELNNCKIEAYELVHRIECYGYKITEKKKNPKILKEFIAKYDPSVKEIKSILAGHDFVTNEGKVIANNLCCLEAEDPRSYAYCSDTMYHPPLMQVLQGTSTIYHESTYLNDLQEKAAERFHSTAREAAIIAKGACAQKLILGHYSSRYLDLEPFRAEAKEVFERVELALEGRVFEV